MPVGAASWSFTEDDFGAITSALERFLTDCNARSALLVDRTGQLVATVGEPLQAGRRLAAVPVGKDHVARQTVP